MVTQTYSPPKINKWGSVKMRTLHKISMYNLKHSSFLVIQWQGVTLIMLRVRFSAWLRCKSTGTTTISKERDLAHHYGALLLIPPWQCLQRSTFDYWIHDPVTRGAFQRQKVPESKHILFISGLENWMRKREKRISSALVQREPHDLKVPSVSFTFFIHHSVYHKHKQYDLSAHSGKQVHLRVQLCSAQCPSQPFSAPSLYCPHPFQCQSTHQTK